MAWTDEVFDVLLALEREAVVEGQPEPERDTIGLVRVRNLSGTVKTRLAEKYGHYLPSAMVTGKLFNLEKAGWIQLYTLGTSRYQGFVVKDHNRVPTHRPTLLPKALQPLDTAYREVIPTKQTVPSLRRQLAEATKEKRKMGKRITELVTTNDKLRFLLRQALEKQDALIAQLVQAQGGFVIHSDPKD